MVFKKESEGQKVGRDQTNISVIQYEGNDTLVWKHSIENFTMGSQLIVHESQEALFVKNGEALDLLPPGRHFLETQNLPLMGKLYQLPAGGAGQVFQAEVYFINQSVQMGIKWGTDSKVRLFDPSTGMHLELGACGEFNLRVTDSRKLVLKLVGTDSTLTVADLLADGGNDSRSRGEHGMFRAMILTLVKSKLAHTIRERAISVLEIDEHLEELSLGLKEKINEALEEYGLFMPEFFVTRIKTPDDNPDFQEVRKRYADQYLRIRREQILKAEAEAAAQRKTVEAETEANLKMIKAQGEATAKKIQGDAQAAVYRMQAAAEAEEMRMKGYTYEQETMRQIGVGAVTGESGGNTGNLSGIPNADSTPQNGSPGNWIKDIAGVSVGLNVMNQVMGMTKDAINPLLQNSQPSGQDAVNIPAPQSGTWNCPCGMTGLNGNFCSNCGRRKGGTEREEK